MKESRGNTCLLLAVRVRIAEDECVLVSGLQGLAGRRPEGAVLSQQGGRLLQAGVVDRRDLLKALTWNAWYSGPSRVR